MPGPGSNPNWPEMHVYVDFTNPGASPTTTWTEITQYCHRLGSGQLFHIDRGRNYERGQTDAGVINIVLDNSKGVFDPKNSSSPFYPNVKPVRKILITAKWLGVTYSLFTGVIEDWPRVWKAAGFWGEVTATGRGPLSSMSAVDLNAAWVAAAIKDGALAIYRLDDASGSVSAANSSSYQQNYAKIAYGDRTTKNDSFSFGSNAGAGNLAGDPTNSLTLTPVDVTNAGYYLQVVPPTDTSGTSPLIMPQTGGWSFEAWFLTTTPTYANTQRQILQQGGAAGGDTIDLVIDNAAPGVSATVGGSLNAAYIAVTDLNIDDGQWHHVLMTFAADAKTLNLYVDGLLVGTNVASSAIGPASAPQFVNVGVQYLPVTIPHGFGYFNGSLKNLAWYLTELSPAQALDHFLAGQGYLGEDTGARIARILAYGGATSVVVDTGNSYLGRANLEGKNVTQAIQDANDTEVGTLYERGDGAIVFKNRQSRNPLNALKVTFGETSGFPYQDDLAMQQDVREVFNTVKVSRDTGLTITLVDTASELDYYPRSLNIASNDNTDTYAVNLGQYQLGRYKTPRNRIPTLTIIPSANVALWPYALGLEIGDRIRVTRNNPGATAMTEDFYIEKVTHDVQTGTWKTSYMLSTAELWDTTFILDSSSFGVLDTSRLGF